METIHSNQQNWKRAKTLVNALKMEQDYGCELSPYAKVLLDNLDKLVKEQIENNAGIKRV